MWQQWIQQNWSQLKSGEKLRAPAHLPHPQTRGFTKLTFSMPNGQVSDWAVSCKDGSRVHIQVFEDGTYKVHRDQFDPRRRLDFTVAHLMTETPVGIGVVLGLVVASSKNSG